MKIIKITEGFITNSSSFNGTIIIGVKKGKDLEILLKKAGIPNEFGQIDADNYENFKDEYEIYGAGITQYYGDYGEGECEPLKWFFEDNEYNSGPLIGDDLILIHCSLD